MKKILILIITLSFFFACGGEVGSTGGNKGDSGSNSSNQGNNDNESPCEKPSAGGNEETPPPLPDC